MPSLPYVSSPGNIDKALTGIKNAAVPERVTQDFVKTILKVPGGSGTEMTTFLKKLGLSNTDGTPSDLYKKFRNPASSGNAMAAAIKTAYAPLYVRNEFMHELNDTELLGLIVEETGQPHDARSIKLTLSAIKHLKGYATYSGALPLSTAEGTPKSEEPVEKTPPPVRRSGGTLGLNLGYTINLNLPATSDSLVFDAIFKSLKEHLLTDSDA